MRFFCVAVQQSCETTAASPPGVALHPHQTSLTSISIVVSLANMLLIQKPDLIVVGKVRVSSCVSSHAQRQTRFIIYGVSSGGGGAAEALTLRLTEGLDFLLQVFQQRQQALTERRRGGNLPTNLCLWLGL